MLNRPDENYYSIRELTRLFGRTRNAIVTAAAKGKLGPAKMVGKRRFYSIEIAEAHYKATTTLEQRQAARNAPTEYEGQANKQNAAAKRQRASEHKNRQDIIRLVDLALELRNRAWIEALNKHGVSLPECFTVREPA